MKKYTIFYRPSLGSFLDEKLINYTRLSEDKVSVKLKDDDAFFQLVVNYIKWYEKIK